MDWGNAIVREINKNGAGTVTSITMELHLAGDFKKTEKKITWLSNSADSPKPIAADLVDFDYLLTKKKIEEDDDWLKFVTPVTEFRQETLVDSNCQVLKKGEVIQFERRGYYIVDEVQNGDSSRKMVFFLVPDGKVATVASKADKSAPTTRGSEKAKPANTEPPATSMYSVKPPTAPGHVDTEGVAMYKVKPIY